ncbi:Ribosome maturation factor RimP [Oleidesulfovibrio alaskensis]|jgi:ribosome maturation factor RimP
MHMTVTTIHEQLLEIITPVIRSFDLELWGMDFIQGGKAVLRIYIDGPDGVTIDQCATVSRHIGLALEVEDIIAGAYNLEVSSPGLERPLFSAAQLAAYKGHKAELVLRAPCAQFPGRKKFTGVVGNVEGENFTLQIDPLKGGDNLQEELSAHWDDVKKARLIYDFDSEKGQKR